MPQNRFVRSEPVEIPEVAGPVTVERRFLRRLRVEVGGTAVPALHREFPLPTHGRLPKRAWIRNAYDPLPALEVDGIVYRFGPHNPWWLRASAVVPFIWIAGGTAGVITAAAGASAAAAVLNTRLTTARKMLATAAASALTVPLASLLGLSTAVLWVSLTGEGPLEPGQVDHGDCVSFEVHEGSPQILRLRDCAEPHQAVVVAAGTVGEPAAQRARSLGPDAFCREAGAVWLSALDDVAVRLSMAVEDRDAEGPSAGGAYACLAEREDGRDWTHEFDSARPR